MRFRRLKVIADTQSISLSRVIDTESGDDIYGVIGIRWEVGIVDGQPRIVLSFDADMIDFETSKPPSKAEKE